MKIGVLLGGISNEREGSLISGNTVLRALEKMGYETLPIDPKKTKKIEEDIKQVDLVFNALHGKNGEDGSIQGFLNTLNAKYTGCNVLSSSIGMNKIIFKKIMKSMNIPTPDYIEIKNDIIDETLKSLGLPFVIKPVYGGGSLGISIVKNYEDAYNTVSKTNKSYKELFAEKYIHGDFLTVSIIQIKMKPIPLPIVNVITDYEFYDYEAKHTKGAAKYIVPANINKESYSRLQECALNIYTTLKCHGAVRVDFLLEKNGNYHVLEINTSPGLSDNSNLVVAAKAQGLSYYDLIENIIASAYSRNEC